MLALVGAILFILATFDADVGDLRLIPAGLFFVALHLAVGYLLPWPRRQPPP